MAKLTAQDIVEALRSSASRLDYAGDGLGYYTRADAFREREAAATISRLTADNEALRKENAELLTRDDPTFTYSFKVRAEKAESRITALEAEVGRLREALELYGNEANWKFGGPCDPNSPHFAGVSFARAALANEEAGQ